MPSPQDRPAPGSAGAPPVARPSGGRDRARIEATAAEAEARLRRVLGHLAERARTTVHADYTALAAAGEGGNVRWAAVAGTTPDAWERTIFPLGNAVAGQAIELNRATTLALPEPAGAARSSGERVHGAIAVPVAYAGEPPVGALVLGWRSVLPPSPRHVALAQQVADDAWVALETGRLFEEAAAAIRAADEARDRAESTESARGMFLATMSHEIRTPLNAVLGYAELLEMEIDGPLNDAQRDRLARLRRTGHHLLSLVTGILDVAKVEAGEMTVQRERGDLLEVLSAALAAIAPQAAAAGIRLTNDCGERSSARFVGDEVRVRQILVNLLSNAVKFTPSGGYVAVSCQRVPHAEIGSPPRASGPWLRVDVADTGVGISPARQLLIFDPFVQGHAPAERAAAGTGLGLTISRRLARLMGGDITLVSAPGVGSRFSLWLPTE